MLPIHRSHTPVIVHHISLELMKMKQTWWLVQRMAKFSITKILTGNLGGTFEENDSLYLAG